MRNGFPHLVTARTARVLSSLIAPALLGALLSGCSNGTTATPPPSNGDGGNTVKLTDANNFSSTSKLKIDPVPVAAEEDLKIDWSMITKDIQGHTVDPTKDIQDVSLIRVKSSSPDEVAGWLNAGTLGSNQIDGDFEYQPAPGVTSAKFSQFSTVGGSGNLDPSKSFKTESGITYLMVFAHGTQLGFGALMMTILSPDASSSVSTVTPTNTSATLTYAADLHSLTPLAIPAGEAPVIDWSGVTKNGASLEIGKRDIDSILIGFYSGKKVSDLEAGFLNLDLKTPAEGGPTMSWESDPMNVQQADLSTAKGRLSEPTFTGFTTDDGTWLIGMFCSSCQNPAPEIVTIVNSQ